MNRSKKTNRSETKPLRFHMPKGYKAYPGSTNDLIDIVDTMTGVVCPVLRNQMKYAQKVTGVFVMKKFKFGNDPRLKSIIEFAIQKKCGMAIVKDQGVYLLAVHKQPDPKDSER